ncbi:LytR C-terminal domain-containing protein [Cellulomonas sp. P22]|uniref:LytR C-terminal domain-containing protein n=1 Tax=Cellulomonas sp. P22 TaxID=3373189 RepID=UPI003788D1FE
MSTDPDRARTLRRRHMHERQAGIFGLLLAGLAVAGIGSAAVFSGAVEVPFLAREFSTATPTIDPDAIYPCPPEGALPVAYDQVQVNVYNASNVGGLATRTGTELAARGFAVIATGNSAQGKNGGGARVSFGTAGVAAAYTLAAHLKDPVLKLDDRQDASVDLVVGQRFNDLLPMDQVTLDPAVVLVGAPSCTPLADVTPVAAPTATATPDPAAEDGTTEGDGAEG